MINAVGIFDILLFCESEVNQELVWKRYTNYFICAIIKTSVNCKYIGMTEGTGTTAALLTEENGSGF